MSQDKKGAVGRLVQAYIAKKAEVTNPAQNIPYYQDSPTDNGDLLTYAEPWGGPQNKPYADAGKPNALEQDTPMTMQGTQPETFQNVQAPEEAPVSTTNVIGDGAAYSKDPSSGDGAPPVGDSVQTKPMGWEESQKQVTPIVTTFPYDEQGDNEEQTTSDLPYKYASAKKAATGDTSMDNNFKASVGRVVKASMVNGSAYRENPYKIKIASLEDLYGFERVSSNDLVHMASKELWSIAASPAGELVIEKRFADDGSTLRV